ncbi:MAG: DUF551 domain-containing protein [Clostridia bacterium]|nr:DUF551 domain-containing protein [Clostridia bacterium]
MTENEKKQIEEMANEIHRADISFLAKGIEIIENAMNEDFVEKIISRQQHIATHLYNAGYRKQEWVSVEDDTPKDGEKRVQVFLRDDDFTKPIGENKIDTDRYIDGKWVRWGKHVTHWMPLPEAPKMKGGAE